MNETEKLPLYPFNPDYLDFQKGVEAGRALERAKFEEVPLEGLTEEIAKQFFKFSFPDLEWGHSGTVDDDSWRRFERKCLYEAQSTLSKLSNGKPLYRRKE